MSAFANLDTGFPMFRPGMSTEQKLQAMEDYLVQVLEQLRYTLGSLGAENFSETALEDLGKVIRRPVEAELSDVEAGLSARITANAEGIETLVEDTGIAGLGPNETLCSRITQNAGTITSLVTKTGVGSLGADETLYSRIAQNAEGISAEVSKSGTGNLGPGEDLYSVFRQRADGIELQVTGASAPEWAAGGTYAAGDVVRVTTAAAEDAPRSIAYYRARSAHTAAAGNMPPSAAYWETAAAPNVRSMIDLNLTGLTLSCDNSRIGYSEWAAGTDYAKGCVVRAASGGTPAFYKAKRDHTAAAGNEPPDAAYWESTAEPVEHNGSFLTLSKDGTVIGGGKVFIKDLDASTIRTGTLDANVITLREAFAVQSRDSLGRWQDCGSLGGYARTNGVNEITITSSNGKCVLGVEDGAVYMEAVDPSDATKVTSVDAFPDYVEIMARSGTDRVWLEVTPQAISFKKSGGVWHDLFDLI